MTSNNKRTYETYVLLVVISSGSYGSESWLFPKVIYKGRFPSLGPLVATALRSWHTRLARMIQPLACVRWDEHPPSLTTSLSHSSKGCILI